MIETEDIKEYLETLRLLCLRRATGKTGPPFPTYSETDLEERKVKTKEDDELYESIRTKLTNNPNAIPVIPFFIKFSKTLPDFWYFIRSRFKSYRERSDFINSSFEDSLRKIEFIGQQNALTLPFQLNENNLTGQYTSTNATQGIESLDIDIRYLDSLIEQLEKTTDPNRLTAFWNICIYGRMVTQHLQKILSHQEGFEEWYAPYQEFMKSDELMVFFKKTRNRLEKESLIYNVGVQVNIKNLKVPEDLIKFGPLPPGVVSFFVGDSIGGSGYIVKGTDGKLYKHYVELPREKIESGLILQGLPKNHKGEKIESPTIEKASRLYVDYLKALVKDAKVKFGR